MCFVEFFINNMSGTPVHRYDRFCTQRAWVILNRKWRCLSYNFYLACRTLESSMKLRRFTLYFRPQNVSETLWPSTHLFSQCVRHNIPMNHDVEIIQLALASQVLPLFPNDYKVTVIRYIQRKTLPFWVLQTITIRVARVNGIDVHPR